MDKLSSKNRLDSKGFSLVGVIVAGGIIATLALSVTKVAEKIAKSERTIVNLHQQNALSTEITNLLSIEQHCRVSLAGPGAKGSPTSPVTLTKSNYDGPGEGLPVKLYTAGSDKISRLNLKFDGTINQKHLGLTIKEIILRFDSTTGPHPSNTSEYQDRADLLVKVEKKSGQSKVTSQLKFPLMVIVATNSSSVATIHSCKIIPPTNAISSSSFTVTGSNFSLGTGAGGTSGSGGKNTFVGGQAGNANTGGAENTFIGKSAGESNTSGNQNTFLGYSSGGNNSTASGGTFMGSISGEQNTTASNNLFIGYSAGKQNTTGTDNVFIGKNAGLNNTTSSENTFWGAYAGEKNTSGSKNSFFGHSAGRQNTSGSNNVFLGFQSGHRNTTSSENVFIGNKAGEANTTGRDNTFFGNRSGTRNTTAQNNTFAGAESGKNNTTGYDNTFLGMSAGGSNTTGTKNVFAGYEAGKDSTTGNNGVFIGTSAGKTIGGGSNNIFLGRGTSPMANMTAGGNNQLNIGNLLLGRMAQLPGTPPSVGNDPELIVNGPLTTNGGIKIGNTNIDCDNSAEGSLRYDSSLKKIYLCNGTEWVSMIEEDDSASDKIIIRAGFSHTCTNSSGVLKCWGDGSYGQLGNGNNFPQYIPANVATPNTSNNDFNLLGKVNSVGLGTTHSCAVTIKGKALCWGSNNSGQLGNGQRMKKITPVPVHTSSSDRSPLSDIASISAGGNTSCAVTTDGRALCWGKNNYGQLGDNSTSDRTTPIAVHTSAGVSSPLSGIKDISVGDEHTCAVTTSGNVLCWGRGNLGKLGNNSYNSSKTPVAVHTSSSNRSPLGGITSVSTGSTNACAITTANNALCWGSNVHGTLGANSNEYLLATPVFVHTSPSNSAHLPNVSSISVGNDFACAVTTDKNAFCWGRASSGQLGNKSSNRTKAPVPVHTSSSDQSPLTGVVAIDSGRDFTCAVTDSNKNFCWGKGNQGQLGNNNTRSSNTPVETRKR